ncbi:MAG: dihydroneopterin aldolase [Nitrospira sp.]|nr:dihydroneopterin aldolase [Nitrospira sp.]
MPDHIVIKRLEFRGRCGVTPEERSRPQPLAVDIEMPYHLESAGVSDDLAHTIDYARVVQRVIEIGTTQDSSLLETLAERIITMLLDEFPITQVKLWVRKLHPPITAVTGSVGVTVERTKPAQQFQHTGLVPSRFLVEQLHRLPKGTALDLAAGQGRHSLFLASHGYQVDAIDRDETALAQLAATAKSRACSAITTRTLDLEQPAPFDPGLGKEKYDVIVVFFYLYRSLFPSLIDALKPGGVLAYETFTIDNYFHHQHPKRWEFCLTPNELLRLSSGLQILHYDEGGHTGNQTSSLVYTAQLLAHKPMRSGPST